ncbi:hypothetical protein FPQ18DRAFT_411989 [Pyronema domesticum]|nr:hypothetical protein FPQ18DRAFT_411989 [Pyronema domesticum]
MCHYVRYYKNSYGNRVYVNFKRPKRRLRSLTSLESLADALPSAGSTIPKPDDCGSNKPAEHKDKENDRRKTMKRIAWRYWDKYYSLDTCAGLTERTHILRISSRSPDEIESDEQLRVSLGLVLPPQDNNYDFIMKDEYDEEDKEAEIYEKYNLGNEGDDEDNRGSRGSKKAESGFENPS